MIKHARLVDCCNIWQVMHKELRVELSNSFNGDSIMVDDISDDYIQDKLSRLETNTFCLVEYIDSKPIGMLMYSESTYGVDIKDLYILPEYRSHGYGLGLMQYLIDMTDKDISLRTQYRNAPAIKLYDKLGFECNNQLIEFTKRGQL